MQGDHTYSDALGQELVNIAQHVEDMGHRVAEVLGDHLGDHHYAGAKLTSAVNRAVEGMVLVGWTEAELIELVREVYERGARTKREFARDFEVS